MPPKTPTIKIVYIALLILTVSSGTLYAQKANFQKTGLSALSKNSTVPLDDNKPFETLSQVSNKPEQFVDQSGCPVCMEDGSDWSNRNLRRANFWSSSLKEANFSKSNLTGANFKDANLTGTNFRDANLSNANFSNANLSYADLTNTELRGANFQNAILFETKLQNANLQGANLTGAVLPRNFSMLNLSTKNLGSPLPSSSLNADVKTVARESTVMIGDSRNGGSGVIIARSGNTYFAVTAAHVVNQLNQYQLQTYDGEKYALNINLVKRLQGVDLAILQFTTSKNYRIIRLTNSDLVGGIEATPVYVAGYVISDKQPRHYRFNSGKIVDNSSGDMSDGYSLSYTNTTFGGMSGGPVLDQDGRLVGIHGRGFTEEMIDKTDNNLVTLSVRYENSFGIPINTLLQLSTEHGIELPLQVERNVAHSEQKNDLESSIAVTIPDTLISRAVQLCNRGFDLLLSNQPNPALTAFLEASRLYPDSQIPWYGKAQSLLLLGRTQEAISALDTSLKKSFQNGEKFHLALLTKGYVLRSLQQYPEAITAYSQIINTPSSDKTGGEELLPFFQSKAFYWRGATYYSIGHIERAIADYGEAIRLNPYFARAYYQRGSVYLELKNKQAAVKDFEQAAIAYRAQGNMAGYQNTRQILSFIKR